MENLNDAEFGSNKSGEEAPILVAQRYLNIFRQVHIFNKAKRDQFDDELLALPNNVMDYFKRMPGGRLLVEHIEDVKTERGISFVKSSREDFDYSDASSVDTPQPSQMQQSAVTQVVGGNVTIDEDFAENLATALATAFSQLQPLQSSSNATPITVELGGAFDVIAEEIKTSRSSLLDVLKETRSITDSVVASQVSISRILESILSARSREENDVANLNNRIIASQASITKMLESLYTSNNQKNNVISGYFDIEKKFQDFKNEVRNNITESLSRIETLLSNILTQSNNKVTYIEQPRNSFSPSEKIIDNINTETLVTQPEERKKKKKKKKNRNSQNVVEGAVVSAIATQVMSDNVEAAVIENEASYDFDDNIVVSGTIRNTEFKHNDDFSNINLDEPPFDDLADTFSTDYNNLEANNFDSISDSDSTIDDLDFVLPEQGSAVDDNFSETLQDSSYREIEDDGLDFTLPEQGSALDHDIISEAIHTVDEGDELGDFTSTFGSDDNEVEEESSEDELSFADESDELGDFASAFDDNNDDEVEEESSVDELSFADEGDELGDFASAFGNDDTEVEEESSVDELSFADEDDELGDFASAFDDNNDDEVEEESSVDELSFADEDDELGDFASAFDNNNDDEVEEESSVDELSFADEGDELGDFASAFGNDDPEVEEESSEDDLSFADESDELGDFASAFDDNNDDEVEEESSVDELSFADEDDELGDFASAFGNNDDDEVEEDISIKINTETTPQQSRYSAELDKIRQALTSDNIDISSLDKPIALDDYSDDENILENEVSSPTINQTASSDISSNDEDWEWEYVDENGNPIENSGDDEDWEWEYVEEEEQK